MDARQGSLSSSPRSRPLVVHVKQLMDYQFRVFRTHMLPNRVYDFSELDSKLGVLQSVVYKIDSDTKVTISNRQTYRVVCGKQGECTIGGGTSVLCLKVVSMYFWQIVISIRSWSIGSLYVIYWILYRNFAQSQDGWKTAR